MKIRLLWAILPVLLGGMSVLIAAQLAEGQHEQKLKGIRRLM